MKALRSKINNIEYLNEKGRFLLFAFLLIFVLFVSFFLFRMAYARYEMNSRLVANLDPDGIIPSNTPYTFRFSVANYTESKQSDVDLTYKVKIRTTTNLPITLQLYRNQLPDDNGAVNLLTGSQSVQDADGAWYRVYSVNSEYSMYFANQTTDYYTLVVNFPLLYAADTTYANSIENIEITLESKQMI